MIVENKLRSIVSYLAILAVFCVPVLDIFRLWENPEASRKITGILTIPLVLVYYLMNTTVRDRLYLLSLLAVFIGDTVFTIDSANFSWGLVLYALGNLMYCLVVFNNIEYLSYKGILLVSVPFFLVYLVPFLYFYEMIEKDFFEIMAYTLSIGFLVLMAWVEFFSRRTIANRWLLGSSIVMVISTLAYGVHMYIEGLLLLKAVVLLAFSGFHWMFSQYVIQSSNEPNELKI